MTDFVPGLEIARLFYQDAVRPILDADFPGLVHSAALLGSGSEVLGFDTEMSRDHNWGPRVDLFLSETDHVRWAEAVNAVLGNKLPFTFGGYSTSFAPWPGSPRSLVPSHEQTRPIRHEVRVLTLEGFLHEYTGLQPESGPGLLDWLVIPEQKLRTLATGAVYHDGLGTLVALQRRVAYYPHDVWLYLLAAQWQRIGQEEPFAGRTGIVGDEVGSAVVAARLVRDMMRLCLLMEMQYAPYPKWFGTAFARLPCAPRLTPMLEMVLRAQNWRVRQQYLADTYEILAQMHNALHITAPVPTHVHPFYERPFWVIGGEDIAQQIYAVIHDEPVRALPMGLGKVDQFIDSTDVLSHDGRCRALLDLYQMPSV